MSRIEASYIIAIYCNVLCTFIRHSDDYGKVNTFHVKHIYNVTHETDTIGMESVKKNTKITGSLGEKIAALYLEKKGYVIIETNYSRKWGEIDIIARKDRLVHFVEVKTVSYETKDLLQYAVTHETWRPEEQVHQFKLHQIEKALETWISDTEYEGDWVIDVMAVRIVPRETYASVRFIENITS